MAEIMPLRGCLVRIAVELGSYLRVRLIWDKMRRCNIVVFG
jgi:hypothetical protein